MEQYKILIEGTINDKNYIVTRIQNWQNKKYWELLINGHIENYVSELEDNCTSDTEAIEILIDSCKELKLLNKEC